MASKIIGRTKCPECGFENAHTKESDKGTQYRYCPDCGSTYHAKGDRQRELLMAKTRLAAPSASPTVPSPTVPSPTGSEQSSEISPVPAALGLGVPPPAAPAAPAKRRGLF